MIRLTLLGSTACLDSAGADLERVVRSPKRLALLAYLAAASPHGYHRRDTLLGLFWPESDQQRARGSLRQTVRHLRSDLGDVIVSRGQEELGLDRDRLWCDVVAFEQALNLKSVAKAMELYRGDLLDGFYLSGAPEFERWLDAERTRLRRRGARAAWKLADEMQEADDVGRWARRAAAFTPHDETAVRRLMNYLDNRGNPIAALQEYERFRKRVHDEIGSPPGPETRALAGTIRREAATPIDASSADRTAIALDEASLATPSGTSSAGVPVREPPVLRRFGRTTLVAGVSIALLLTLGTTQILDRRGDEFRLGDVTHLTSDAGLELYPALSPDGEEVAYVAGVPGSFDVHLRRVSGGRAIPLTEELPGSHVWPVWSPDGEKLAFVTVRDFSHFTLHIIPALGGPHRVLYESPDPRWIAAPTWSPDGEEVAFALGHALFKAKVGTGEIAKLGDAWEPNSLAWAPTGERIAFVSENFQYAGAVELGNHAPTSIWTIPADGGAPEILVPVDKVNQSPAWLPDGRHLLYVSNRAGARDLYLQPLDDAFSPIGSPLRLTTGLDLLTFAISADGARLVYDLPLLAANLWTIPIPSLEEAPVSISTARKLTFGNQFIETLRVSPDGRWLAFDSNRNGNQDIYKMPVDGGQALQLTRYPADDFGPDWSPDGQEIVFYSFHDGTRHLFLIDSNGQRAEQLTFGDESQAFPTWSPDNHQIAFQTTPFAAGAKAPLQLARMRRADSDDSWEAPEVLSDEWSQVPRWSPDGTRIAALGPGRIGLFDVHAGEWTQLIDSLSYRGPPVWRPDGRGLYIVATIEDQSGIWHIPLEGEPQRLVTIPEAFLRRKWLDSDGEQFFFTKSETREADIWVVDLKGGP